MDKSTSVIPAKAGIQKHSAPATAFGHHNPDCRSHGHQSQTDNFGIRETMPAEPFVAAEKLKQETPERIDYAIDCQYLAVPFAAPVGRNQQRINNKIEESFIKLDRMTVGSMKVDAPGEI